MLKEFCAENYTHIEQAVNSGAGRIELCDNLAEGGTTPSVGVIQKTLKFAQSEQIPTMVMVRPRGGNFVYTEAEFEIMKMDMQVIKDLGAEGVVFGCLTEDGRVDRQKTSELVKQADGLETVFHMAFDHITPESQTEELEWLIDQGITRVLTHGGVGGSVFDHEERLQSVLQQAGDRIEILLGGGVHADNAEEIQNTFNVNQLHGTRIVSF